MEYFVKLLLVLHVFGGTVALLAGALSLFSAKGKKVHRKSGAIFFYAMNLVGGSAFLLSLIKSNYFLLAIALFTTYLNFVGYRALKSKSMKYSLMDWFVAFFAVANAAYMVYTFQVVMVAFGCILLFVLFRNTSSQFGGEEQLKKLREKRLLMHLGNMCGAYIAACTAFLVVNINFVKPPWILWLLPTFIGVPFIILQSRKEKQKQTSS